MATEGLLGEIQLCKSPIAEVFKNSINNINLIKYIFLWNIHYKKDISQNPDWDINPC